MLQLKSVVTSLPTAPHLFFWNHSIYWSLFSPPHLGIHKSSSWEGGSKYEFSTQETGVAIDPGWRSLTGILLEAYRWASCWNLSIVSTSLLHPLAFLMTFHIFSLQSWRFRPRILGSGGEKLITQKYRVGSSSLLSFFPIGEAPPTSSNLCFVTLGLSFPISSNSKESAFIAEDLRSIPGLGRFPEEGNGNPLQYSCLENPMDRWDWQATVHGVAKSQTWLSD